MAARRVGRSLDNEMITAPLISAPILTGHGVIQGGFKTATEARTLAQILNAGALPVPLKIVKTERLPAR